MNEGKTCDAVIRLLEGRTGETRSAVSHPERIGIGPPVDLRFNLGSQSYALEHTQIEAFPGQIHMGEEFGHFIEPVVAALSGHLPAPAVYYVSFPLNARLAIRANRMGEARRSFIAWVREHAQRLDDANPEAPTRERNPHGIQGQHRGRPPEFPYEVILSRVAHWTQAPRHHGVLRVSRIAPDNVEKLRASRLRQAFDRKCPKLQRCRENGARTVLVLEDSDVALSNHIVIGDGLAGALAERDDLPDEIYLVETRVDTWAVRQMKMDGDLVPADRSREFSADELADLTGTGRVQGR